MILFQKYFFPILSWLLIYFYPTAQFILLIGFFVTMDTITGMLAARKEGQEITSKKFREVIRKFVVYSAAILTAHVIQMQFFPEFPATKMIGGLIAYSELMSIDENIARITGVSLFKFFIKKLKK